MSLALVFDLDGTLIDATADLAASVNAVLSGAGLQPLLPQEIVSFVGDGAYFLLKRALDVHGAGKRAEELLPRFRAHYFAHCTAATRAYPGVPQTLAALRPRPLGVVTNKPQPMTEKILSWLGLDRLFVAVLGPERTGEVQKPDPRPILAACAALQSAPADTLMVGDHWTDLEAGRLAGVRRVFAAYGLGKKGKEMPDFTIAAFPELLGVVARAEGQG